MLDIHCHILPGVDDGPRTIDEAITLARFCVRDGITHVIATPHCHRHLRLGRNEIVPLASQFNTTLRAEGIRLEVFPGSEIQLYDGDLYRRDYETGYYCHLGDDPAFTLLEFPWHVKEYPDDAPAHLRWLHAHGTRAIIAHPERYRYFQTETQQLSALVDEGAWLQVTVDSLLGNHGAEAEAAGWQLLAAHPNAVLATDAHGPGRCSGLAVGYRLVAERLGDSRAEDLRRRANVILAHLLRGTQKVD